MHIEVHLTWANPSQQVAEKLARLRAADALQGRTVRPGIHFHCVVRETNDEAWTKSNALIRHVNRDAVGKAPERFHRMDSEGSQRQRSECFTCAAVVEAIFLGSRFKLFRCGRHSAVRRGSAAKGRQLRDTARPGCAKSDVCG